MHENVCIYVDKRGREYCNDPKAVITTVFAICISNARHAINHVVTI